MQAQYLDWRAGVSWNKSDFYDLFGPTTRSRKGLALRLGYDKVLVYDPPRRLDWTNDLAYFNHIDTLPDAQNVGSGFTRLLTAESKLNYSDLRRSLGAVDDEKGVQWTASLAANRAGANRAGANASALVHAGIDLGMALPWTHSSLWSRTAVGAASGKADDPKASFYFGGFGNNRVDNGAVKRYREFGAMPGFELDAIPARRFIRQMVEWNLPPLIFETVGVPAFHLTWLRPALFATALRTGGDNTPGSRNYTSLGGQIDLRISVQHWNEMFLSFGAASARRGSQGVGHEWMVSLKVL